MPVEVTPLVNGVTVATQAMPHLESVAMGLWIGAGARSEAASEHGISHLLEHMAFKGTSRRSAREIAEAVEAVGGEMNAETSVDHTSYYVRLLKEDLALGVDVLGDIVTDPLFEADDLAREQHVIIQEIGAAEDSPEDLAFDMFQEAAFPGQAIGRSILGTPESIGAHTSGDLRRFLRSQYCGSRTVLAATGNLDHDEVVRLAETHLAGLPDTPPPTPDPGTYRGGERKLARPLQEAQVVFGFAGPSYGHPNFHAAHLLSAVLGAGWPSRLFQEIREERGLCYSIYSVLLALRRYRPVRRSCRDLGGGSGRAHAAHPGRTAQDGGRVTRGGAAPRQGAAAVRPADGSGKPDRAAGQIGRHILIHGRPLGLQEMVDKVEAVTKPMLRPRQPVSWDSFRLWRPSGRSDPLADVGQFATDCPAGKWPSAGSEVLMAFLRASTSFEKPDHIRQGRVPACSRPWPITRMGAAALRKPHPFSRLGTDLACDDLTRAAFRRRIRRYQVRDARRSFLCILYLQPAGSSCSARVTLSNVTRGMTQTGTVGLLDGRAIRQPRNDDPRRSSSCPFAFNALRLHRLEAACLPHNGASMRLLEKIGFRARDWREGSSASTAAGRTISFSPCCRTIRCHNAAAAPLYDLHSAWAVRAGVALWSATASFTALVLKSVAGVARCAPSTV
jgi:hypothetical protein